ncbi:MAG: preprotein translocase subunit SecE [Acidaminococcaceae bacterium]|nr:preprotein translocase subunit SecE [Acidaminococcaceae bacterium]
MTVPETTSTNEISTLGKVTGFIKESKAELQKVTWPTKQELFMNTIVVLIAVVLVAVSIWIADTVFSVLIRTILR